LIDLNKIKQELVVFLRNSNIFTTSLRGVTTDTQTGSVNGLTITIAKPNVKNIRSVKIGEGFLSFGSDYNVNYDSSGSCLITFTTTQNDTYEISYDFGTDKIYPDFPRPELSISSFPRISVDIVSVLSTPAGLGKVLESEITFTVVVYEKNVDALYDYLTDIRTKFFDSWTGFYYLKSVITPISIGPLVPSPFTFGKDKIMMQNIDFRSVFNFER
jgi:hypothetical protein